MASMKKWEAYLFEDIITMFRGGEPLFLRADERENYIANSLTKQDDEYDKE